MPGVYVALANSHFGALAKRETEHLKNKHKTLPRRKNHPEVKFNETQKLKSFSNQFSLNQHNVITKCFPMTGLCACPGEGWWIGNKGEQDKPLRSFVSVSTEHTESSFPNDTADI